MRPWIMVGERSPELQKPGRPRTRWLYLERYPAGGCGTDSHALRIRYRVRLDERGVAAGIGAGWQDKMNLNLLRSIGRKVESIRFHLEPGCWSICFLRAIEMDNRDLVVTFIVADIAHG